MSSFIKIAALTGLALQAAKGLTLDTTSPDSIKQASATIVYNLTQYYHNNETSTASADVGLFPKPPYYWWEAAAVWGALIDYYSYTNDSSYNPTISQALLAQVGTNNDYMPESQVSTLGNDDQAFYALACMDAVEYGFPNPPSGQPDWLQLATNVWNAQAQRWDTSTCGGGLRWQVQAFNAGYDYKNSASNAAFFQLSARLARYTGNQTYVQWAGVTWDWMTSTGLITPTGDVYDGTSTTSDCKTLDHLQWTYEAGALLYGASILYNYTNATSTWNGRVSTILNGTASTFFPNSSNIMSEVACEPSGNCNTDQFAFKGMLARWMAKSTVVAPFTHDQISTLLTSSAKGAAQACSGGDSETTCGQKWYTGSYDDSTGVGQELSALSVIQSLLLLDGNVKTAALHPLTQSSTGTTSSTTSNTTSSTTSTTTSPAASYTGAGVQMRGGVTAAVLALAFVITLQVVL